ncbi:Uncharacterised protein [Bordetella pertussis]|nr:Uncharacterised protein [Bordetella pertussis]CFP02510.1 Uncharacterised protein [Bordetella pertussis]CFU69285.1 Uncharacterised protein [Bordetella pertussis]CPO42313.1 Uncharacterised protein [Bordetella pertussis]CPO88254.1 Uncharacterised protein [Bordetella pertussis]
MGAQRLEHGQGLGVAVDIVLQFAAGIADGLRVDEDRRDAGVDQRRLQRADARYLEGVHHVAGGKHRPAFAFAFVGRIEELQLHLRGREGDAVELEVAAFLHLAVDDGNMAQDGLADVGLPDPHHGGAIARDAVRIDQSAFDGEGAHRGAQVAAVAAPVDEGAVDGDLAEQVVDVVAGALAAVQDDRLAGAGGGAAHAVDLLAVRVGAADHPQQQRVARRSRHLGRGRQVLQAEEHALAGAPAHVGGADLELGKESHVFDSLRSWGGATRAPPWEGQAVCVDSRKSWANRCSTPPAS